ncbi:MAG TPA: metal-binding protein [Acidobacteria bacterium]|nr:metal-binding protein [Acidobacteriota bacterium]
MHATMDLETPPLPLLPRTPEEGARRIALSFLDQAAAAFPRLQDPADTEALHDYRVALRRLRSCLRAYRPVLGGSPGKKLLRRLRRLAQATGPGRDLEVQMEWLRAQAKHLAASHRAGLTWMVQQLEGQMPAALHQVRDHLEEEFPVLEQGLRQSLSVYRTEVHLDPRAEPPSFGAVTAGILREQVDELAAHLSRIADEDDETEAHEARICGKRLRYLLEPLLEELPAAAPLVKRLKGLQEVLGDLHDAHVLETGLAAATVRAATDRYAGLFVLAIQEAPDPQALRAARRGAVENGLIALGRLNRARRDRLFRKLHEDWLGGRAADFLAELRSVIEP